MSEVKFSPGTAVEYRKQHPEDSPDIWYPATFIKEIRDGSFEIKYRDPNAAGAVTLSVDSLHIRPSPPACTTVNTTFQLLEKVDAFCNSGWSSGVVTKVLSEGRYIVYFKRTRKEKELRHTDLRLPMTQINGKWVHSSQDAAMISKPQENKDINLGDNGKISLAPENSSVVKKSKEVRNGQQERALPSGKASFDAKSISSTRIKGCNKNQPLRDRTSKLLKKVTVPKELQSSLEEFDAQMNPTEQLDQPETLEVLISDVNLITCMEQSKNGNQAHAKSANPWRRRETPEGNFDSRINMTTPLRGKKRRGPGRPPGSVSRTPRASVGEVDSKQKSVTDSLQSYIQKPIVISLPCYNNSQWNKLQAQNNSKLLIQNVAEVQEEKKQLPNAVTDRSKEVKGLKNEGITPKRKRGRPFGSFSAGKRKVDEIGGELTVHGSTQRRSTRERREVYKTAIDSLKPKGKKLKTNTDIISSIQEIEANLKEKAEGVLTNRIKEYIESDTLEVSGNISDEDKPLSAWFGEAHSLPNPTKLNPGANASQSGNLDAKIDNMSSDKCRKETTKSDDVDLAQSASQHDSDDGTIRQRDEEKMIEVVANVLPFIKASPIWQVIESMEVFKQIPQDPHFQPLYDTKEHCREGLAICSMVTFSRLAEDIPKFQFDDPTNILEDSMETLSDLERQGFNVELIRSRLNLLLSIKREHELSHNLAKEIEEEEKERAGIDQELVEIDKKMAELREKRELIVLEKQKKDSKIGGLQLRFDSVREALDAARSEFERVANAPW